MDDENRKSSVISVSSHVAIGAVGNRAAVFALEAFGFPVWAIHTIMLPWHPGHGPAKRIVPNDQDFAEFTINVTQSSQRKTLGAILTGYFASVSQVHAIAEMISVLKEENKDILYVCDPVVGDHGSIYVPKEIAEAIREKLLPLADVITPNAYELSWLTGYSQPTSIEGTIELASMLEPAEKLLTSVPVENEEQTGSLFLGHNECWLTIHPKIVNPPNGLGDLTSAIFLSKKMMGMTNHENLKTTTASVFEILTHTAELKSNELTLETQTENLLAPNIDFPIINLKAKA